MSFFIFVNSLSSGGAERVVSKLANYWINSKNNVVVVTFSSIDDFYILNKDVEIIRLNFNSSKTGLSRVKERIRIIRELRKLVKERQPSFILSFTVRINVFSLFSLFGINKCMIISERNNPMEKLSLSYSLLRKVLYKTASGAIYQTERAKKIFDKKFPYLNSIVIPNPIDKNTTFNINKENIILSVGRLQNQKGHTYLLKAFSKSRYIENNYYLYIAGDGNLKIDLLNEAKYLGIDKYVVFLGRQENINQWYLKSKIFAFSSLYEGFPNALAEAMSIGLPSVSFDCPTGPAELINDNKNGFLVPLYDTDLFSDRLNELMLNECLQKELGANAIKSTQYLDSKNISDKYLSYCITRSENV